MEEMVRLLWLVVTEDQHLLLANHQATRLVVLEGTRWHIHLLSNLI